MIPCYILGSLKVLLNLILRLKKSIINSHFINEATLTQGDKWQIEIHTIIKWWSLEPNSGLSQSSAVIFSSMLYYNHKGMK